MPLLVSIALAAIASPLGPDSVSPSTPSTVFLPVPGARTPAEVSIKAKGGTTVIAGVPSPGWVEVQLRAESGARSVDLRVKGPAGTSRYGFEVNSPARPSLTLDVHPKRLTLGRGVGVVKIVGDNLPDTANIGLKASRGSLGAIQETEDGWVATWTPPARMNKTGVVVFTAADTSTPDGARTWSRLELGAPESVEVQGPMQGQISLTVEDRSYPAQALGQRSQTTFEITRYPSAATATATIMSLDDGERTEEISLPPTGQPELMFVPTAEPWLTPAGSPVTLWLAAVDAAGRPLEDLSSIDISGPGTVRREKADEGWIALKLTAPVGAAPWSVTARIGESLSFVGAQSRPDLPRAEIMMPDAQGESLPVLARLRSSQGQPWNGRVAIWGEAFEPIIAETDRAGSTPALDTRPSRLTPGLACVEPSLGNNSGRVETVITWADKHSISPGESTRVFAVALDAWGIPVDTPIDMSVDGARIPIRAKSPAGVVLGTWDGPNTEGLFSLTASTADRVDHAALRVGERFTTRLGSAGTEQDRIAASAWREAVRCLDLANATQSPPEQTSVTYSQAAEPLPEPAPPEQPAPSTAPTPEIPDTPEEPSPWGDDEPSPWGNP